MIKIIPPGSYDFAEAALSQIKLSRRGLVGADRHELQKRASAELLDAFRHLEIRPGEIPIHLLALGTTGRYGPNRNADGFQDETCRRDHGTFVKHAKWYRHHANTDPAESWGRVAYSTFNEPMGRIELIVALNGTKEAAQANGGHVAHKEMDKLSRGEEIAVSMATAVPFDTCSSCYNKARTRAEYCDSKTCTKYGGLKKNLGRTFADGHTLHADNPVNRWKDISYVDRPADRTAYVMGRMDKAASAVMQGGADLAALYPACSAIVPELAGSPALRQQAKAAAALDRACCNPGNRAKLLAFSVPSLATSDAGWHRTKVASVLALSASECAPLSLTSFLAIAAGDLATAKAAAHRVAPFVPGTYAELLAEGESAFRANPFPADFRERAHYGPCDARGRQLVDGSRLDKVALARRTATAALHPHTIGYGHDSTGHGPSPAIAAVARCYALYKVAVLSIRGDDPQFEDLVEAAAAQDLAEIASSRDS